MLGLLVLAAALEVGGDAAIRHGLLRASWPWLLVGALGLTAYGLVVNANRLIDFGRLMGLYIAVLFVVCVEVAGKKLRSVSSRPGESRRGRASLDRRSCRRLERGQPWDVGCWSH